MELLALLLALGLLWLLIKVMSRPNYAESPTVTVGRAITFPSKIERKLHENERRAEELGIYNIASDSDWDTDENYRKAIALTCPICKKPMTLWDFVHGYGAHYHCMYR